MLASPQPVYYFESAVTALQTMKNKSILALASLALATLFANPVVSHAEDRVVLTDNAPAVVHVTVVEKTSAAAGLKNLITETGTPVVYTSSERPAPVYKTVADMRAIEASKAHRNSQEARVIRSMASGESPHRYYSANPSVTNEAAEMAYVRATILRLLTRASSGDQ